LRALFFLLWLLPGAAFAGPHTLAVLYFDNTGNPELEPLKVGLAQMLITDLQGTDGVTVVERARLQAVLDELALGHSETVDPATAARVGMLLGAEWILLGSYFELMGTLRIDTRLVQVQTGKILLSTGENGPRSEFMAFEKALADTVRAGLLAQLDPAGRGEVPPSSPRGVDGSTGRTEGGTGATGQTAAHPATPVVARRDPEALEAAVAYSEGLIHLDRREVTRARESFEKALAANPDLQAARDELKGLDI
jgi:TolB-like protein